MCQRLVKWKEEGKRNQWQLRPFFDSAGCQQILSHHVLSASTIANTTEEKRNVVGGRRGGGSGVGSVTETLNSSVNYSSVREADVRCVS